MAQEPEGVKLLELDERSYKVGPVLVADPDFTEWLVEHKLLVLVALHAIGLACWGTMLLFAVILG